ncbi:MAG: HAD family hydrolase [Chloroflexi bacterium]|nr:HAD family hydrolase [Chloroflexota bacterium]
MIRGIIFDLGGTLMHFDGTWEEIDKVSTANLVAFLGANGVTVPEDFRARFLEHRKWHWNRAEQTGFEARVEDALRDTLVELGHASLDGWLPRAVEAYFAPNESHWFLFPDTHATLDILRARGLRIGLISNADDEGLVFRQVQRLDLEKYLDPVVCSASDPRWRKPDPRIFHLISDAWGIAPHEIVMVGDSPRYDIIGGHRAGMRAILTERGTNMPWQKIPDELANDPEWQADAVVGALAEIPNVLDRWRVQ